MNENKKRNSLNEDYDELMEILKDVVTAVRDALIDMVVRVYETFTRICVLIYNKLEYILFLIHYNAIDLVIKKIGKDLYRAAETLDITHSRHYYEYNIMGGLFLTFHISKTTIQEVEEFSIIYLVSKKDKQMAAGSIFFYIRDDKDNSKEIINKIRKTLRQDIDSFNTEV